MNQGNSVQTPPAPAMAEKDKTRVFHLITDTGVGGAEKILKEVVLGLDHARFEHRAACLKTPGRTARELTAAGVSVWSLNLPKEFGPAYALRLAAGFPGLVQRIKSFKPHILHCWLFQANLVGRFAARAAKVPVNISSLRVIEAEKTFQYPLDRFTKSLVSCYVAVCDAVARHYENALRLPPDRVRVIKNGIDPEPFGKVAKDYARGRLSLPQGALAVGAMGRLHPQKGMDILLRAAALLGPRFPEVVVLIAGQGPERERLEALAGSLGLGERVRFLGEWPDSPGFMAGIDLFALPSRWEGLPNVVLEAMAAGVPVVAAEVGGAGELLISGRPEREAPGETGILVPRENPKALAEAMAALIKNPSRRKIMGENARERVKQNFLLERMLREYETLYEELRERTSLARS